MRLTAENFNDEAHQVDHGLQRRAHLVTHGRFKIFCLLLLLVLLSPLDPKQLTSNLSRHVRDIDGYSGFAHAVQRSNLDRSEKELFLAFVLLVGSAATFLPPLPSDRSVKLVDKVFGGIVPLRFLTNYLIERFVVVHLHDLLCRLLQIKFNQLVIEDARVDQGQ